MRKMILATATALSMAAVPALAQVHDVDDKRDMTPDQQTVYDSFDDDQRAQFDAWPSDYRYTYFGWEPEVRTYYWTLDDNQKDAWWYLDDNQRVQLYNITDVTVRESTWTSIHEQLAAMNMHKHTATVKQVNFVSNEVVQTVDVPARAHDFNYPVCQTDMDDHCINPWAAGLRGPDVNRPLGYWPGESVTEMRKGG